jgi:hypothetical protein
MLEIRRCEFIAALGGAMQRGRSSPAACGGSAF